LKISTGAITIYSVNLKKAQDELARQDRRLDAAIQFASSQKTLDANLRMPLLPEATLRQTDSMSRNFPGSSLTTLKERNPEP
jgi:hypothetical protein